MKMQEHIQQILAQEAQLDSHCLFTCVVLDFWAD